MRRSVYVGYRNVYLYEPMSHIVYSAIDAFGGGPLFWILNWSCSELKLRVFEQGRYVSLVSCFSPFYYF